MRAEGKHPQSTRENRNGGERWPGQRARERVRGWPSGLGASVVAGPAEVLPRWAGVSGRHGDVGPGFVHGRGMATHPLKTQGIGNAADCWENWDYAKDWGRSVAGEAVPPPPGRSRPARLVLRASWPLRNAVAVFSICGQGVSETEGRSVIRTTICRRAGGGGATDHPGGPVPGGQLQHDPLSTRGPRGPHAARPAGVVSFPREH